MMTPPFAGLSQSALSTTLALHSPLGPSPSGLSERDTATGALVVASISTGSLANPTAPIPFVPEPVLVPGPEPSHEQLTTIRAIAITTAAPQCPPAAPIALKHTAPSQSAPCLHVPSRVDGRRSAVPLSLCFLLRATTAAAAATTPAATLALMRSRPATSPAAHRYSHTTSWEAVERCPCEE